MDDANYLDLNISGTKFEVDRGLLSKYPSTYLGRLAGDREFKSEGNSIVLQRSVTSFEAILMFYQTGKLHIPSQICPKAFKDELDFWEIDITTLEKCCLHKYLTLRSNVEIMGTFHAYEEAKVSQGNWSPGRGKINRWRCRIWCIIDNRENSIQAKVYLSLAVLFVLVSIFSIALSTLPVFQDIPRSCKGREEFLQKYRSSVHNALFEFVKQLPCDDATNDAFGDYIEYWDNFYGYADNESLADDFSDFLRKLKLPFKTHLPIIFAYLDYSVIAFFTLELVVRLCTCPNLKRYFFSVMNILEIIVLLAGYAYVIIDDFIVAYRLVIKEIEVLQYLQMLRAFRLFRVIQNVKAIRVLGYSLKHSYHDILVLIMLMFVGVLVFANVMYFVENSSDFPSIPDTWWWCVITMTTVGYGDMIPKTITGKIIGSMCALSGIILLSMVIPIFANTYMSLYQFANLETESEKRGKNIIEEKSCKKKSKSIYTISQT